MHVLEKVVACLIRNDPVYPTWLSLILGVGGILSLFFAAYCVGVGFKYPNSPNWDKRKKVLIAIWIVGPPTWLWIDYFFLYRVWGISGPVSHEAMKYGQEVVAKFWVGVGTLLSGLYYGNDVIKVLKR